MQLNTTWFAAHRIRLAMVSNNGSLPGAYGAVVEVDETYFGEVPGKGVRCGAGHKEMVFTLLDRKNGVRSFHIAGGKFAGINEAMANNVSPDAHLNTD